MATFQVMFTTSIEIEAEDRLTALSMARKMFDRELEDGEITVNDFTTKTIKFE